MTEENMRLLWKKNEGLFDAVTFDLRVPAEKEEAGYWECSFNTFVQSQHLVRIPYCIQYIVVLLPQFNKKDFAAADKILELRFGLRSWRSVRKYSTISQDG
jgi:hypothetical protein